MSVVIYEDLELMLLRFELNVVMKFMFFVQITTAALIVSAAALC